MVDAVRRGPGPSGEENPGHIRERLEI